MTVDVQERSKTYANTMIPQPKPIKVHVIAKEDDGGISWELDIKTSGYGQGTKKIDAKAGIGYEIQFDLVNPDNLDVRFDASGPIYVREGDGSFCPTKLGSGQIMIDSCNDDELVVIDWNYEKVVLNYQLNFVTMTGKPVNPCDPIIENGGGGTHPFV